MNLSKETIRQEVKYKVFYKDIHILYSWLYSKSFFKKTFKNRVVNSLYFDSPSYDFAMSNMSGESNRIKIRARWYNDSQQDFFKSFTSKDQRFNFEIKRKSNSFSDKLTLDSIGFCKQESFEERIKNLKNVVQRQLKDNNYLLHLITRETVFTSYEREYYQDTLMNGVRLTIDKNISFTDQIQDHGLTKLSKDYVIVELKFNPSKIGFVLAITEKFPFKQVRSSKYLASLAQLKRVSY